MNSFKYKCIQTYTNQFSNKTTLEPMYLLFLSPYFSHLSTYKSGKSAQPNGNIQFGYARIPFSFCLLDSKCAKCFPNVQSVSQWNNGNFTLKIHVIVVSFISDPLSMYIIPMRCHDGRRAVVWFFFFFKSAISWSIDDCVRRDGCVPKSPSTNHGYAFAIRRPRTVAHTVQSEFFNRIFM